MCTSISTVRPRGHQCSVRLRASHRGPGARRRSHSAHGSERTLLETRDRCRACCATPERRGGPSGTLCRLLQGASLARRHPYVPPADPLLPIYAHHSKALDACDAETGAGHATRRLRKAEGHLGAPSVAAPRQPRPTLPACAPRPPSPPQALREVRIFFIQIGFAFWVQPLTVT